MADSSSQKVEVSTPKNDKLKVLKEEEVTSQEYYTQIHYILKWKQSCFQLSKS